MAAITPLEIITGLLWVTVVVLGWMAKRQIERTDALERGKADKAELSASVERIERAAREQRQESRENFGRVFERLDQLVDRWPK